MKRILTGTLSCGLILALFLVPVGAQEADDPADQPLKSKRTQRQTDQREERARPQTDMQNDRSPRDRSPSRGSGGRPILMVPSRWVTIYADFDHDGLIDSKETISILDLMEARRDSRERRVAERFRRRPWRNPADSEPMIQLQGTLEDQAEFTLRGHGDDKFLMAHLHTKDDKTARVVLGMREDLKKLNLSEGQTVTVQGERHRINNKPVLFARTVTAQGQTVNVSPLEAQGEHRVRGTIESLEERRFRGREGEFLVARVELVNGRTRTINLGPSSLLESLKLNEGDKIRVMARNGRINDRPALIAAEIHANGQSVDIPRSRSRPTDKTVDWNRRENPSERQTRRQQDFEATRNR